MEVNSYYFMNLGSYLSVGIGKKEGNEYGFGVLRLGDQDIDRGFLLKQGVQG